MKKLLSAAVLLLIFLMMSCTAQNSQSQTLNKKWNLVSFKNYSKDYLAKKNAWVDFSTPAKEPGNYGAFMGCNRMFFRAEILNGNRIKISDLGSTMMACGQMTLESDFTKIFPGMNYYKITGNQLILKDSAGNEMKFTATEN